jgi:hypothetical protein
MIVQTTARIQLVVQMVNHVIDGLPTFLQRNCHPTTPALMHIPLKQTNGQLENQRKPRLYQLGPFLTSL